MRTLRLPARLARVLATIAVGAGLVLAGPALSASAAPAGGIMPMKACAPAPEPARPTAGLPGKLAPKPFMGVDNPWTSENEAAGGAKGDPFSNPNVTISDVYGYSYKWVDYDTGCLTGSGWGTNMMTGVSNFMLATSASTNALTHSSLNFVVTPTWLSPLDGAITSATDMVKKGFFGPWFTPVLVLVAAGVLIAASRADISKAITSTGWALVVLIAATYIMSYPVSSAQAVDGLIQETVTTSARASGTYVPQPGDGPVTQEPIKPGAGQEAAEMSAAARALNQQMDVINRNTLYDAWLEGTLGSSTSKLATTYGPDLFRASHLTWDEAATVEADPKGQGKAIIDAKKDLWVKTAASVESEDATAYRQLTGQAGRWDAAFMVGLQIAVTMPFLLVAGVFVVVAYGATRLFIPLVPALGVFGMLEVARGWVIATVGQVARIILFGVLFWLAALVNISMVTAVLKSEMAWGLKFIIAMMMPILLFKLLKPKSSVPGLGFVKALGRAKLNSMFTRRAVADGIEDAEDDSRPLSNSGGATGSNKPNGGWKSHAPVASTPAPYEQPVKALPVGSRPSADDTARPGQDVSVAGSRRQDVAVNRAGNRPTFAGAIEGTPQGRHALTGTSRPELVAAPVPSPVYAADRPHAAITSDPSERAAITAEASTEGVRARKEYVATSPEADLSAPVQIMRADERVPEGVSQANVQVVDGEEVFVIWRPDGASTTHSVDAQEDF
ncbi:hypothetical protein H9623_17905 [Oerskovia sp. Sa1BUA8]|uniref:TrbL/VirB6 plasmid conjugal transfer protein n=1 Tax=Oerskovia douganii TaxID=2762210 RepID=A0A9D5UBQ5_9CELL|nr:hypothetical protein [Oerskovia douganii]MBE7702168.1 hypothetical protein [Oerskovia douganii]